MTDLALATVTEFCQSASISSINSAIFLYRQAIQERGPSNFRNIASMSGLSDALVTRWFHNRQSQDLDETASVLQDALRLLLTSYSDPSYLQSRHLAVTIARSISNGRGDGFLWVTRLRVQRPNVHTQDEEAHRLSRQGAVIAMQSSLSGNVADLDKAVMLLEKALRIVSVGHPRRYEIVGNLAATLEIRSRRTGHLPDLPRAITLLQDIVKVLPPTNPDRSTALNNLASILMTRFQQTAQMADLEEAIMLFQQVLTLHPSSHHMHSTYNLANALLTRFKQSRQAVDLEKGVSLCREALASSSPRHPEHFVLLGTLAMAIFMRFEQTGQPADLDETILLHREALPHIPVSHPRRPYSLETLANALLLQLEQAGHAGDVEEVISLQREALALRPVPHPKRAVSLHYLAKAIHNRFEEAGQLVDLDEAISLHREALTLRPPPHPERSHSLDGIANILLTRFQQTGQMIDLEEAIMLFREDLMLHPAPLSNRSAVLGNLANAFSTRFQQIGQIGDLEETIRLNREAITLVSTTHPSRSGLLNNLANAVSARFKQTAQAADLEDSIDLHREALTLSPFQHPNRSAALNNLSAAISTRFEQTGQMADLEEAIVLLKECLELRPDPHPERSTSLSNLANTFSWRFDQTGREEDLEKAIALHRDALALRPHPHPDRSASLNNLANTVFKLFSQKHRTVDLDEAISLRREVLDCLPTFHPARCLSFKNLAFCLCTKSGASDVPSDSDQLLDMAMNLFRSALSCDTSPILDRLNAAGLWANQADIYRHSSALDAYQAGIQFFSQAAMLAPDIQARHRLMADRLGPTNHVNSAAACAIRSGKFDQAVEMLEEGRSIVWSQVLQLRTPLDDLRQVNPELAQQLQDLSRDLEQTSLRQVSRNVRDTEQGMMAIEAEATRFRQLHETRLETLGRVRALEGFEKFLLPQGLASLKKAAMHGPVIIINSTQSSCDALIITSTGVEHVPVSSNLTGLDAVVLVKSIMHTTGFKGSAPLPQELQIPLASLVQDAVQTRDPTLSEQDRHLGRRKTHPAAMRDPDDVFRSVLATLWKSVVQPVILRLNLEVRISLATDTTRAHLEFL